MGCSVTTRIQATPAQVFWFLADPTTASVIDPAVVSYLPEGGAMGLGVKNQIRMKMLGIPVRLTSETIEWEPGKRMVFRSIKPGRPAVGVATHLFEGCPEGTEYTWSMAFVPTGIGGRVMARLVDQVGHAGCSIFGLPTFLVLARRPVGVSGR